MKDRNNFPIEFVAAKKNIQVFLFEVATSHGLGVFWKLLFRWKGSIYKLVWQNLAVYLVLYSSLSLTYRLLLEGEARVSTVIIAFPHPVCCRQSLSKSLYTARGLLI